MLEHFFDELELKTHDTKPAFITAADSISYSELISKINHATYQLFTNGYTDGIIAIILPNSIEVCTTILSCLKAKVTFVSLDINAPINELKKILNYLKPKYIITDKKFWPEINCEWQVISLEKLFSPRTEAKHVPTLYPDKEAFITLTSGSTGFIKGVVHTNFSLCEAISNVLTSLNLHQSHRLLCTISHPSNAFLRNMLACLIRGATFILGHQANFENVLTLIETSKPTHIRFSIRDLLATAQLSNEYQVIFSSVQRCDVSGDVIPPSIIDRVNSLISNGKLITSYAMSECGTIAINEATRDKSLQNLTGKIINTIQVKIADEEENALRTDEVGELYVKSTTLFKTYLHLPEESNNAFTADGWFKTGDYFSINADNYLEFHGRKKNIIIRDGKNINPHYVRELILAWPEILDCVIINSASKITLHEPIALCTIKNTLNKGNFIKYLQENINAIWSPNIIYILKKLPRTIFGKIDLNYITQHYGSLIGDAENKILMQ